MTRCMFSITLFSGAHIQEINSSYTAATQQYYLETQSITIQFLFWRSPNYMLNFVYFSFLLSAPVLQEVSNIKNIDSDTARKADNNIAVIFTVFGLLIKLTSCVLSVKKD